MQNKKETLSQNWGLTFIFLSTLGFALSAILSKFLLKEGMAVLPILFWRFLGMALVLFVFLGWQGRARLPTRDAARCLAVGAFGDTLVAFTFLFAIDRLGASLAALLLYVYPIFVFIVEKFLYGVSIGKAQWVALLLASVGAFFVIDPHVDMSIDPWGLAAGLGSALIYAFYLCFISRWVAHIPPLACSAYIGLGATCTLGALSLAIQGFALPPTAVSSLVLTAQVAVGTIMPLTLFYAGIKILGPAKTALVFTLEPVFIVVLAMGLFHEQVSIQKLLGALCILMAVVWIQLLTIKKPRAPSSL